MSRNGKHPRALVFHHADGHRWALPIDDTVTFNVGGQTIALVDLVDITLEDAAIAELEVDVLGTEVDPGTPVAEWGIPRADEPGDVVPGSLSAH